MRQLICWQLYITFLSNCFYRIMLMMVPPICATWKAASLPLGSIMPQKRSQRQIQMLGFSSAVVPIKVQAYLVTLNLIFAATRPLFQSSWSMVTRFIILVREAISLLLKLDLPYTNFYYFISQRTQLWAVIEGMDMRIFMLQCGDCRCPQEFYLELSDYLDPLESTDLLGLEDVFCLADMGLFMIIFCLSILFSGLFYFWRLVQV